MSAFLSTTGQLDIESKWIFRMLTISQMSYCPWYKQEFVAILCTTGIFLLPPVFHFGEKVIEDHFQRLYLKSEKPVLYATLEGGHFKHGDEKGNYGRVSTTLLHRGQFALGEWRYMIEAGKILGSVPYLLLKFIQGKESGAYNRFEFAMMKQPGIYCRHLWNSFYRVNHEWDNFQQYSADKTFESERNSFIQNGLRHAERFACHTHEHTITFSRIYATILRSKYRICNLFGVLSIQCISGDCLIWTKPIYKKAELNWM